MALLDACENGTLLDRSWKIDSVYPSLLSILFLEIFHLFVRITPMFIELDFLCNKKVSFDKYVQTEIDSSCETMKKVPWSLVLQSSHLGDAFGCREATSSIIFSYDRYGSRFQDSTRSREES